jgi:hypothetical protein
MRTMKGVPNKASLLLRLAFFALPLPLIFPPANAQDQANPASQLPDGPLPAPAPDYSQWVVTFSNPEDKNKGPGSSSTSAMITTTKTGYIIHEEIVNGSGAKLDEWHVGNTLYTKGSGSTLWNEARSGRSSSFEAFPASGFRNLDWVTRNSYVGTIVLAGHSCLVFVPERPQKLDLSDPVQLDALTTYAFLDANSRLPVKVRFNGVTSIYQFKDPPTEKLTLPPDLTSQLKKNEEAVESLNKPMPRPY